MQSNKYHYICDMNISCLPNKFNYKSDFDFLLLLKDCQGKAVGWPQWDFKAKFYTSQKAICFEAWKRGDETHNCYEDNGAIHIVANSHGLGKGRLNVEFTAELPNGIYPDGSQRVVSRATLDIELTDSAECPIPAIGVEVPIPIAIYDFALRSEVAGLANTTKDFNDDFSDDFSN